MKNLLWPKISVVLMALALVASFALVPAVVNANGYDSTLDLTSKDPTTWEPTTAMKATLNYKASSPTFDFEIVNATGLEPTTEYSLIYYANPWPGNHPGALLGGPWLGSVIMANVIGSVNLDMSLPTPPDSNMAVPHNVPPDNYFHAYGAKIWLIPSSDYDGSGLTAWNPDDYLYETDLIQYTDTDLSTGSGGIAITTTITEPVTTIGLTVSPPSIPFGDVDVGTCSPVEVITLTNTGTVPIKVLATTSVGFYTDCLKLNGVAANGWVSTKILAGNSLTVNAKVCPTIAYSGTITGSVSFVASFAQ